jgi:catechol 2,3-dioxygenase-like lactoylglutathione lyase family enzyme
MSATKAVYLRAAPYADDAMNLPVKDVASAIPYYERTFGFRVVTRKDEPPATVTLARDEVQIGLAENGGDPEQEGCFFEVDDVEAAFIEINKAPPVATSFRVSKFDDVDYRAFFVIAPDGLCYLVGQRTTAAGG